MIHAPPDAVYAIAADITAWPEILSPYRYVKSADPADVDMPGYRKRFKIGARRGPIPWTWTSSQVVRPWDRRIVYYHVRGMTRGMDVEWRIEPRDGGTKVTVIHALTSPYIWLRSGVAEFILGRIFIEHIAETTLRGMKAHAEAQAAPQSAL